MGRGGDSGGSEVLYGKTMPRRPSVEQQPEESLHASGAPTVVVVRDPDYNNEITVDGGDVQIVDIDQPESLVTIADEYGVEDVAVVLDGYRAEVAHLGKHHPARQHVEWLIEEAFNEIDGMDSQVLKPVVSPKHDPDKPTLVISRHPDYQNEYFTDGEVRFVDIDLGSQFNGPDDFSSLDPAEQREYLERLEQERDALSEGNKARRAIEGILAELAPQARS